MFKSVILAVGVLSAADAVAQDHYAGLPQQPRSHKVQMDFECTADFKVHSVRLTMESSEKGTRYAPRLTSILVNEKPLGDEYVIVVQKIIDKFSSLPQAIMMCSEDGAALYLGPHYRKLDFRKGKFIRGPHVVDVLSIRPDGVSVSGQMEIAR